MAQCDPIKQALRDPARARIAGLLIAFGLFAGSPALAQETQLDVTTTSFRYDGAGRLVGEIGPDPDGSGPSGPLRYPAKRTTYDPTGLVIKVETGELDDWYPTNIAPNAWTGFTILRTERLTYDSLNQLVKTEVIGSDGVVVSVTQANYDRVGRSACTAVRMNTTTFDTLPASACDLASPDDRIAQNLYDAAGQLNTVRRAVGTPLQQDYASYTYSANGKQTSMTDARGFKATFEYDGFDRQVAWIFPHKDTPGVSATCNIGAITVAGGIMGPSGAYNASDDCEKYSYDANGNRARLAKRDGSVLTYSFDNLNRVTTIIVPDMPLPVRADENKPYTRDVYYTYDLRGLQTSARFDSTTGDGIITDYDGFGRISSTTQSIGGVNRALTYTYDANGNRTRITYPDQAYVTYGYDRLNRPTLVQQAGVNPLRSYSYTPLGSLDLESVAGGAAGSNDYDYDPVGRLGAMTRNLSGTTWDNTTAFQYNSASQISQETRSNDAYLYTGRQNGTLNYDTNGLNQYATISGNQYCHDANGNLTADGDFVYLYDVENRLVEKRVQTNTICTALAYEGQLKARLLYDPLGRLYQVTGDTTGTTQFLIDGNAMVGEYSDSDTMLRRYVHGSNGEVDDPIAWYEGAAMGSANARLFFTNQQGSIVAPIDMSGAPLRLFKYDEYGVAQASDSAAPGALVPANGARFLFTGQAWLPELGLYYYKARIYSPRLGRFMQTDPIGYEDQSNLYAYVGNDPTNFVDPDGMRETTPCVTTHCAPPVPKEVPTTASPNRLPTIVVAARSATVVGLTLSTACSSRCPSETKRVYATYTRTNSRTGQIYSGRTSIVVPASTPDRAAGLMALTRRGGGHHMDELGYGPLVLDQTSTNYNAIRGREQQLIDFNGGAESIGGSSGNAINGIGDWNPYRSIYMMEASGAFGKLPNNRPDQ